MSRQVFIMNECVSETRIGFGLLLRVRAKCSGLGLLLGVGASAQGLGHCLASALTLSVRVSASA